MAEVTQRSADIVGDPFLVVDPRWARLVGLLQYLAAAVGALVSGGTFVLWLVTPSMLAGDPAIMQWNTALTILFTAVALLLIRTRRRLAGWLVVIPILISVSAAVSNLRGVRGPFEQLLPVVAAAAPPGLSRPGTAVATLLVCGTIMAFAFGDGRASAPTWLSTTISVSTAFIIMIVISLVGVTVFSYFETLRGDQTQIASPQGTYGFGFLLLSWVCVWTLDGQWRPLLSHGISAAVLRWLSVVAIVLPILPATVLTFALAKGALTPLLALTLMAGFIAVGGLAVGVRVFVTTRRLERSLIEQAMVDAMTGLWNVGAFSRLAEQKLADARRRREDVTIIVVDLDGLKVVNDTYGHAAGSDMIRAMAHCLALAAREDDVAARIGGDEFALVMRASATAADAVLQRLRHIARDLNESGVHPWSLSFSAGAATSNGYSSVDELLRQADEAMYAQKARRRESREGS